MFRTLILLSISFLFTCCTGNTSGTDADTNSDSKTTAVESTKMNYEASHEAPYCKFWVMKNAIGMNDPSNFKGRWFDLKTDGTFKSGQWQETSNSGTWSIEEETMIISLVFKNPETIPSNWAIQGAGGGGRILFKGNVKGNEKGLQVALEPENEMPVKE